MLVFDVLPATNEYDLFNEAAGFKSPHLILTEHLIIRPLVNSDRDAILDAIYDTLKTGCIWIPWLAKQPAAEKYIKIGNKFYRDSKRGKTMSFVVHNDDKFMGMCIIGNYCHTTKSAWVGYWCRKDFNDPNYFVEAVNAVIRYAYTKTPIIEIVFPCTVGNFIGEYAAKLLNFKLQKIDITSRRQLKFYKTTHLTDLPKLSNFWIVDEPAAS